MTLPPLEPTRKLVVRILLLFLLGELFVPGLARADAIVWNQAMSASTIAEFFVEEERVVVELEIGIPDFEAFQLLLPNEVYERLGNSPRSWPERLEIFFAEAFPIVPSGNTPLRGRVVEMESRPRLRRDPISGEAVSTSEDQDEEIIIFVRLEYSLEAPPAALTFSAPVGAGIGFIVYHEGIAVNDFRYLALSQTLHLDWADPWYSRFENRNLRRRYFAPMSGFLYIEHYEVRKEIIARPFDLQKWVDLGLEGRQTIPVEMQAELLRKVAAFLHDHHVVEIDGVAAPPELARINFLERTLKTSRVVDPPRELDIHAAILGAIFVYPIDGLPERVTLDWDLWNDQLETVPAASVDQAGSLPVLLQRDWRVLEWRNFLKKPDLPTLYVLESPPSTLERAMLPGRWVFVALACFAGLRAARVRSRATAGLAAATLLLTGLAFWGSWNTGLSDPRYRELVGGLLHNVYRAFDFRDESRIYDVLARSAHGDLLEQLFLETRRGLELQSQGGARARVKRVELIDLAVAPAAGRAFTAVVAWNVAGSVGHWGHIHERRNRYRAELDVAPVDGAWKLVRVTILEEERI
ncbi:MAG: hypothetical protein IH881_17790 [Myxococcales bacterium]|nr:hypothetical protein [Myxococcales bacterium]